MDIRSYDLYPKILVAVDCIIFGFDGSKLKVLLIKRGFAPEKGKWSLIGGFIDVDENVSKAAQRILFQWTGIKKVYMEQVHVFTDATRDTADRVISIACFALIDISGTRGRVQEVHGACWFPLEDIPPLIFDHSEMLAKAKEQLRQKVVNAPVAFELLPGKFTIPQLQILYEAIYERSIDKRNFARKILGLGVLNKLKEKERTTSKKGAHYFMFDKVRYNRIRSTTVKFL